MLLEMLFGMTFFVLPVVGMFGMLILTAMKKGKREDEEVSIKEPYVQQKLHTRQEPYLQQKLFIKQKAVKGTVVPFRKKDLPTYALHNFEKEDKYIGKLRIREDTS